MDLKLKHILIVVGVLGFSAFGLFAKVPYSFAVTAKLYPAKKWVLIRDTDGSLVSTLYNHKEGVLSNYRSYKLSNGDVASMAILPKPTTSGYIKVGDSVAVLYSTLTDEKINLAKSQLQELRSLLIVEQTGLKDADIKQVQEELISAEKQLALETINYERLKKLYEEGVIASSEFNLAEGSYEFARARVNITQKHLHSAKTGAKQEQLDYTLARIASAEKELQMLERQKESHTLVSPIGGKIDFNVTYEEVISVEDTSAYVLHFPVKISDKPYLTSFSKIVVSNPLGGTSMEGSIIDISDKVEYLNSYQLVFAKAKLLSKADNVNSGMFLSCKVICDKISIAEYINRILAKAVN